MSLKIVQETTFNAMLSKVAALKGRFSSIASSKAKGLEDWLDTQDVCTLLHISPRTLQTFRSNGTLAFSQIGGKYYYHKNSVSKLIGVKK